MAGTAMSGGWEPCPALGPGWRRREAFRKSGATCGRSDTYYQSPTGQKFRSKIELSRFLGPERDLDNFDFKNGLERSGPPKPRKGPKWRRPMGPPPEPGGGAKEEAPPTPPSEAPPPAKAPPTPPSEATPPAEAPPTPEQPLPPRRTRKRPSPPEPPQEGVVACCGGCQGLFPGVTLPTQRRCRWLCPECRARRREFNREQRFFKRVGCGSCGACLLPRDCGICSACARPSPAKCLLRRCLRIVKKGWGCGSCGGCLSTEDCGSCCFCQRRLQPGRKRQWRCLRRRCLRPQRSGVNKKPPPGPRKLTVKWNPAPEREPSAAPSTRHRKQPAKEKKKPGRPPKHPGTRGGGRSRGSRRCGACSGCERPVDCGRCDFCRDKPKFGGRNRKRQKCRWRQCLRRAMSPGPPPAHEVLTCRPPRLRSVDDLVELLCDLESYRPCPGPPGVTPRPPAPRCHVENSRQAIATPPFPRPRPPFVAPPPRKS
ncbi:methyl-CpG-binding domain protein 1 [Caloenas nicobarica]|uniref:methyl-CpG-binding domain protein 1 n=1 Tax=Caloenas nicobarica TaxID=187106 RepID=UPI0032B6FE05